MIDNVSAPFDVAGDDNFGVVFFTCTATCTRDAIPKWLHGKFVVMRAVGADVHYGFSKDATATIDATAAAAAAGTVTSVGGIIPDGITLETHRRIPGARPDETLYFIRDATGACTVRIELADDRSPTA
jgi:hypothetical protein